MTFRPPRLVVRYADPGDRGWMLERLRQSWGASATVVAAGHLHDLTELPAFVAVLDGDPVTNGGACGWSLCAATQ
jgi:hypothetical protein